VQHIERLAAGKGIQALYLFTETASDFFHHKGYERVDRAEVPEAVQQSSEFSHVCPQSALVMRKKL
jgi:amino-acid N-acetyltransferase